MGFHFAPTPKHSTDTFGDCTTTTIIIVIVIVIVINTSNG